MNPLHFLVDAFVNTFGITRPDPDRKTLAGRLIALMLVGVLLLLGFAAWILRGGLTRS